MKEIDNTFLRLRLETKAFDLIKEERILAQKANSERNIEALSKHQQRYEIMFEFAQKLGLVSKDRSPRDPNTRI